MNLVYSNWCRLCASSSEKSVPIFEEDGISSFAEKIKSYLHVDITSLSNANEVPRMCNSCSERITDWDHYAEHVQKVQGIFLSLSGVEDQNELMRKFSEELSMMREKNDEKETSSSAIKTEKTYECVKDRKRGKHKKSKKVKAVPVECNDGDFSEEDDIPLALQIDCLSDLKNNSGDQSEGDAESEDVTKKKTVHRIKLKIKAIQDKSHEVINENEDEVDDGIETGEKEADNSLNDDESSSSSKNSKIKMAGLQSLFTKIAAVWCVNDLNYCKFREYALLRTLE